MRVLIVSPWLPHPQVMHAGGQHLYHTVRCLAGRGHTLHVLCYGREEPAEHVRVLAAHCASLHVLTPAYTSRQKVARLRNGGWRDPWTLGRRTHHEARAMIWSICGEHDIDVVHLAWTEMVRYLGTVPRGVGTVLGTMDVESAVRPREVRLVPLGRRWWEALKACRLIAAERQALSRVDVTLACSEADRAQLARIGGTDRVRVVHPWVDVQAVCRIGPEPLVPGRLTFMGAMDRLANVAAARFLVDAVWPRVRAAHPVATLRIVGVDPPPSLLRCAEGDARLMVTGFVPDLAAEWAQTDVAVSPSLIGGGLVTKVAQPMAAGRPVVTTSLGNEGVGAPVGTAVEVADDAPSFAAAVQRLLVDRDRWARLAAAGRRHALERFDWGTSMQRLEAAYVVAAARARGET
jgi:glycosyltransferase involved in cell wall biosynthesis